MSFTPTMRYVILSSGFRNSLGFSSAFASERELGRNRAAEAVERAATGQRYVSRPIDIDILLYDDEVISTPELTIPHPGIAEREFVLTPLCEVLRQRPHPVLGLTMGELRDNLLRKTK